jgi:galactokinase
MNATPAAFVERFGWPPEVVAEAPGRVNLIGEHTDYNCGFVLPIAIPQKTRVELARRNDQHVRVVSALGAAEFDLGAEQRTGQWSDYVAGVTATLRLHGFVLGGFDLRIDSDVPPGSGLSSSAALEVALLRALRGAFHLSLSDGALAKLAQEGENDFVGAPVGMMDPMAVMFADPRTAIFLDARSGFYERVALPPDLDFVVIDSGEKHLIVGGGFRERRAQCERAASLLGVRSLRELDLTNLGDVARLPRPLDRRARHVVTENARVLRALNALEMRDDRAFGKLLDESHASMRDDLEVSTPAIDQLVGIAQRDDTVYGARLTGGGFGGSIVAATARGAAAEAGTRILRAYSALGHSGTLLVPEVSANGGRA